MDRCVLLVKPSRTIDEVRFIVQNPQDIYITSPPQNPKAGQVFLYKTDNPRLEGIIYLLIKLNNKHCLTSIFRPLLIVNFSALSLT